MEKDDEVKGNGNSLDFGARIYDPRLGRFLSIDPKVKSFPFYSPYSFSSDKPILFIDIAGEKGVIYIQVMTDESGKPLIDKATIEDAVKIIKNEFSKINVDCDVKYVISNDPLTKKEFQNRKEYDKSDSYILIGTKKQIKKHNENYKNTGWPLLKTNYDGYEGTSDGKSDQDFYGVLNYDNFKVWHSTTWGYKLAQRVLHESGHPKFRFHPDNYANGDYPNKKPYLSGVPGHVDNTVMDDEKIVIKHDNFMIKRLQKLHGKIRKTYRETKEKEI